MKAFGGGSLGAIRGVARCVDQVKFVLCQENPAVDDLVAGALKVGALNLKVMELLDAANTGVYGRPEPTEALRGLLATLPVDLTFVDAEDRIRYFSEGPDRVFARSEAMIGRVHGHMV